MAINLANNFKTLKTLEINYSDNDFQTLYRSAIPQDEFGKVISYKEARKDLTLLEKFKSFLGYKEDDTPDPFLGAFHLVLNVDISSDSSFIPFAYVDNSDENKMKCALDIINEQQNNIKFNFTQLVKALSDSCGTAIESVSFKTYFENDDLMLDNIKIDEADATPEQKQYVLNGLQTDGSFINILSNSYKAKGIAEELYYNILSFDIDIVTGRKLTNFLVISEHENEIVYFTQIRIRALRDIASIIRTKYISDISRKKLHEAEKSAKAAIMSRNMSHNLGSHVMSYLKHHLSTVKDMLNDKILSQLIENEDELESFIVKTGWKQIHGDINKTIEVTTENGLPGKENINNTEQPQNSDSNIPDNGEIKDEENNEVIPEKEVDKIALPFLVGLGQFISYLQERQDFIATIATDYVPYYSNVNFKDFIYDELNSDKRYERHPDRQNLKSDNILLGNIARSEGLGRTTRPTDVEGKKALNDIVLKFRSTFTGDPVERIMPAKGKPGVEPLNYYKDEDEVKMACKELEEMRDYDVSLPGGIVGRQAIFSIFENVIRNAAKHGDWREKGKLELTIDIFSKQDVLSPDNNIKKRFGKDNGDENSLTLQEVLQKFYCNKTEGDNLYFVTLTDNLTISVENLNSLRKALIEDYIDSQGQMINANKGIKEMRISSAWLRSIDDNPKDSIIQPSIGDKNWDSSNLKVPPVLYARISKDEKGSHLQYIFCLLRPQIVALITSKIAEVENNQINSILQKKFWSLFTPDSYLKYKNKSFSFVIYDDISDTEDEKENDKDTIFNKIRRFSSPRVIKLSDLQKKGLDEISLIRDIILAGKSHSDVKGLEALMDGAVTSLYRYLSDWNSNEKIYINDIKAENKFDTDRNVNPNLSDKITFDKNDSDARYRYVTHLEGKNEFKYYVVDNEPKDTRAFVFSEGITGNNSTDRLVRNESLTDNWFYRHIYAMKQKVAIIDERIFSKTYGVEESSFVIGKIANYGTAGDTEEERLKNDKASLMLLFPNYYDELSMTKSRQELDDFTVFMDYNPKTGKDLDTVDAESHLGATFAEKNVYVFSIIRSIENSEEPVFYLYGFESDKSKPNFSRCIRYASISWDYENSQMKFIPCNDICNTILKDFNFLSIHQGLLDKLYDAFKIKESKQSSKEKEELTKKLYNVFSNSKVFGFKDENEKEDVTHYFLPGMTIHSGRSKPSKSDMPQHLPFVPYSAIEHAVLDCKFSLIELLNSARYE